MAGTIGLFAISWLTTALQGRDYVQRRTGLTYAEYARRGYFQLLAVAAIALVLLLVTNSHLHRRRALRRGVLALCVATGFVLVSALQRLSLYFDAFGYSMLRLWCVVAALWIGAAFVVGAARVIPAVSARVSMIGVVCCCAIGAVVSFNAINPEALVVRHNVARRGAEPVDLVYLQALSTDADLGLVDRLDALTPGERRAVVARICNEKTSSRDVWSWNRSESALRQRKATLCK